MQQEGEKAQGKALQKTVEKSATKEKGKTQIEAEKAKEKLEAEAEKAKEKIQESEKKVD